MIEMITDEELDKICEDRSLEFARVARHLNGPETSGSEYYVGALWGFRKCEAMMREKRDDFYDEIKEITDGLCHLFHCDFVDSKGPCNCQINTIASMLHSALERNATDQKKD